MEYASLVPKLSSAGGKAPQDGAKWQEPHLLLIPCTHCAPGTNILFVTFVPMEAPMSSRVLIHLMYVRLFCANSFFRYEHGFSRTRSSLATALCDLTAVCSGVKPRDRKVWFQTPEGHTFWNMGGFTYHHSWTFRHQSVVHSLLAPSRWSVNEEPCQMLQCKIYPTSRMDVKMTELSSLTWRVE